MWAEGKIALPPPTPPKKKEKKLNKDSKLMQ